MTYSSVYPPGEKTHRDENFPVASYVISKKHRAAVLAFYRFARAADDVADHPHLSEDRKIERLDQFEATLLGKSNEVAEALPLRGVIEQRDLSPRHALDLLVAFRQDASKSRYRDWDELMHYCRYSAAPVGRFVLDVHGESGATWPASDALCSALQIINHLQDCKADYLRLNRIYIPQDAFARNGITELSLAEPKATPALRQCIAELAKKTLQLLEPSQLSPQIEDMRLKVEVRIIERLADKLLKVLLLRDPLSERVHLNKLQFISIALHAVLATVSFRAFNRRD